MFKQHFQCKLGWNKVKYARITITHVCFIALTLAGVTGRNFPPVSFFPGERMGRPILSPGKKLTVTPGPSDDVEHSAFGPRVQTASSGPILGNQGVTHSVPTASCDECSGNGMGHAWVTEDVGTRQMLMHEKTCVIPIFSSLT